MNLRLLNLGLVALAVPLVLVGCAAGSRVPPTPCSNDEQCAPGQVCFSDGCRDPAEGVVLELVTTTAAGTLVEDQALPRVSSGMTVEFEPQPRWTGQLLHRGAPYTGEVSLEVSGGSALLPGRSRSLEQPLQTDAQGRFEVTLPTGALQLTCLPKATSVPPVTATHTFENDELFARDLVLPTPVRLEGTVLEGSGPDAGVWTGANLELQALSPEAPHHPLSQPVRASAAGTFALDVAPPDGGTLLLRAVPVDPKALVPRRTTRVTLPGPVRLELGMSGPAVTVQGVTIGPDGQPVSGASVFIGGLVTGGGDFRSPSALTGDDGRFSLSALPNAPNQPLTLQLSPPAGTPAGLHTQPVQVGSTHVNLGEVRLPQRVQVTGALVTDSGAGASNTSVDVVAIAAVTGRPVPASARATTDAQGSFSVFLDPGVYRLDVKPSGLPRLSRLVTVEPPPASPPVLDGLVLSAGTSLRARVQRGPGRSGEPIRKASVRLYRLSVHGALRVPVLLGEGVTDETGTFEVLYPSR